MDLKIELKKCPFCGGTAKMSEDIRFGYAVVCPKCMVGTKRFEFLQDAVDVWNNRKGKKDDRE